MAAPFKLFVYGLVSRRINEEGSDTRGGDKYGFDSCGIRMRGCLGEGFIKECYEGGFSHFYWKSVMCSRD